MSSLRLVPTSLRRNLASAMIVATAAVCTASVGAEDWPQWGGPERNFHVDDRPVAEAWPPTGPPVLWSLGIGPGHSSPIVSGGTVYVSYRDQDDEVLLALSADHGGMAWRHRQEAKLWDGFNEQFGKGPHVTPLVTGDHLITVTVRGDILAFERRSGEIAWTQSLWTRGVRPADRGYASSPLALGDAVILPVPGKDGGLLALDAATGRELWHNPKLGNPAFASPLATQLGGQEQIVAFFGTGVAGLDPADGRELWRHEHRTKYNINASPPLVLPDRDLVVVSSAYDTGTRAIGVERSVDGTWSTTDRWFERKLQVHHQSLIALGDMVIGTSGDFGPAFLVGLDLETGTPRVRQRGLAKANLIAIGEDRALALDEDGQLALLRIHAASSDDGGDSEPIEVVRRAQVLDSRSWAAPALVGTTVFVRDQRTVKALDLTPTPQAERPE